MSDSTPGDSPIFDVETVRNLVELMKQHDITEIDLKEEGQRIRLRRGSDQPPTITYAAAPPAVAAAPASAAPAPAAAAPAPVEDDNHLVIKSPMIGTFYVAPNPDAPPYVKVGDHVGPDTIVCMIESMKMFTEVPAEISGKIVSVLIKNGESVDVNRPMFKVEAN